MARKQKLKVYRTPIGFHDAYVAAPSQKAALEAWGSDANLFARGVAEVVTDKALSREPLANPGEIIRRPRGSPDEQLAAASPARPRSKPAAASRTPTPAKPKKRPRPRPPRDALNKAEHDLDALLARQREEDGALRERERELERARRELNRAHDRDRARAERRVEKERDAHARALDRWIEDQA